MKTDLQHLQSFGTCSGDEDIAVIQVFDVLQAANCSAFVKHFVSRRQEGGGGVGGKEERHIRCKTEEKEADAGA